VALAQIAECLPLRPRDPRAAGRPGHVAAGARCQSGHSAQPASGPASVGLAGGFPATLRFHASTMPCCGTPTGKQGADVRNRPYSQYPQQSPINHQPSPHPVLGWQEKQYQPPTIPSPPLTHYSHPNSNSPPPQSILNSSYPQPGFNPSTLSGASYQTSSIVRPPPSLPPSPPPVGSYGPISTVSPPPPTKGYLIPTDEGKLSVSIDFGTSIPSSLEHSLPFPDHFNFTGTTFSGIVRTLPILTARCVARTDRMTSPFLKAYGSSRIAAGQVQQILHWPGSFETFRKIPTCLLYSDDGQVLAWGLEAKNASPMPGTIKCEWSVLVVHPIILSYSAYPYGICAIS